MQHISEILTKLEAKLLKQKKAISETEAHIAVIRRVADESSQTDIEAAIAESAKNKKDPTHK